MYPVNIIGLDYIFSKPFSCNMCIFVFSCVVAVRPIETLVCIMHSRGWGWGGVLGVTH